MHVLKICLISRDCYTCPLQKGWKFRGSWIGIRFPISFLIALMFFIFLFNIIYLFVYHSFYFSSRIRWSERNTTGRQIKSDSSLCCRFDVYKVKRRNATVAYEFDTYAF